MYIDFTTTTLNENSPTYALLLLLEQTEEGPHQQYTQGLEANPESLKWVNTVLKNYLKKNPNAPANEISHMIDFLKQEENNKKLRRSEKMAFEVVAKKTKDWDEKLKKETAQATTGKDVTQGLIDQYGVPTTKPVKDWGQYKIVELDNKASYKIEGAIMNHCVGGDNSYYDHKDEHTIFSFRHPDDTPIVTMDLYQGNTIVQFRGKGNSIPSRKYIDYLLEWLNENNYKVMDRELDMLHIYKASKYPILGKLYDFTIIHLNDDDYLYPPTGQLKPKDAGFCAI